MKFLDIRNDIYLMKNIKTFEGFFDFAKVKKDRHFRIFNFFVTSVVNKDDLIRITVFYHFFKFRNSVDLNIMWNWFFEMAIIMNSSLNILKFLFKNKNINYADMDFFH
jgi:hypothetical protein